MSDTQERTALTPHQDPERWIPHLRRLLERELDVCTKLASFGDEQGRLIRHGETEKLLAILGQRQTLIDELMQLNESLAPFRRDWDQYLDRIPQTEQEEVRHIVTRIKGCVQKISERDDQDREALEQRRGQISQRLGAVDKGRGAIAAYRTSTPTVEPRFQDREA